MDLSATLVKRFVKATNDAAAPAKAKQAAQIYGTTVVDGGQTYVRLDGSDVLTPVSKVTDAQNGDRVLVSIENHKAVVTGNVTCPASARMALDLEPDLDVAVGKIDTLYGDVLVYKEATFDKITAAEANITKLSGEIIEYRDAAFGRVTAVEGRIDNLSGEVLEYRNATFEKVEAAEGEIKKLSGEVLEYKEATLDKVNATLAEIDELHATKAYVDTLVAGEITADRITSMIGQIDDLYATKASIQDLESITISAAQITTGTLDASKITVTNLDAGSITTGFINGHLIPPGAIDMDRLSEGVVTSLDTANLNAALAIANADEAAATAATAMTTADGKNSTFYQDSAPGTAGRKPNDIWFDTDDGNKMYYFNGSSWAAKQFGTDAIANLSITNALIANGAIDSAKISSLDAGKIVAGSITSTQLAANAITADKLAIADFTNYAQLNDFTYNKWGFTRTTDTGGAIYQMAVLARDKFISEYQTVNGGEAFRIKGQISTSCKGNATSGGTDSSYRGTAIGIYCYDGNKSSVGIPYSVRVTGSASAPWTSIDVTVTIPATARYIRIFVQTESWGNFSGAIKLRNIEVLRAASGELIVDGAITAGKIQAGTITAGCIASGAIETKHLMANAITADKIAIGNFNNLSIIDPDNSNPYNATVTTINGQKYFQFGSATAAGYHSLVLRQFPANTVFAIGDKYKLRAKGYKTGGTINVILRMFYADGTWLNFGSVATAIPTSNGDISAEFQITSLPTAGKTISYIKLFLEIANSANLVYIRDITVYQMGTGSLIVDGTITAGKIADGAVGTVKIADGAITANKLSVGSGGNLYATGYDTFENIPQVDDRIWYEKSGAAKVSIDTSVAYYGSRCLKIEAGNTDSYVYLGDKSNGYGCIPVVAGQNYIVSAWMKSSGTTNAQLWVVGKDYKDNGHDQHVNGGSITVGTSWTRVVTKYTASAGYPYISLRVDNDSNGTSLWVDAIQIEKASSTSQGPSEFSPAGTTVIDGGRIATNSIKAAQIDVVNLFAQKVEATNLTIKGKSELQGVRATDLTVTGNSTFKGEVNATKLNLKEINNLGGNSYATCIETSTIAKNDTSKELSTSFTIRPNAENYLNALEARLTIYQNYNSTLGGTTSGISLDANNISLNAYNHISMFSEGGIDIIGDVNIAEGNLIIKDNIIKKTIPGTRKMGSGGYVYAAVVGGYIAVVIEISGFTLSSTYTWTEVARIDISALGVSLTRQTKGTAYISGGGPMYSDIMTCAFARANSGTTVQIDAQVNKAVSAKWYNATLLIPIVNYMYE